MQAGVCEHPSLQLDGEVYLRVCTSGETVHGFHQTFKGVPDPY